MLSGAPFSPEARPVARRHGDRRHACADLRPSGMGGHGECRAAIIGIPGDAGGSGGSVLVGTQGPRTASGAGHPAGHDPVRCDPVCAGRDAAPAGHHEARRDPAGSLPAFHPDLCRHWRCDCAQGPAGAGRLGPEYHAVGRIPCRCADHRCRPSGAGDPAAGRGARPVAGACGAGLFSLARMAVTAARATAAARKPAGSASCCGSGLRDQSGGTGRALESGIAGQFPAPDH